MKQILDQITALHTELTSKTSEPSKQLSPLKALTEQLKRGSKGRTSTARPGPPAAHPADSLHPELAGQIDLVLKELQRVNRKIKSNLQLLQPYVTFLRTAQQVTGHWMQLLENICGFYSKPKSDTAVCILTLYFTLGLKTNSLSSVVKGVISNI